MESCRGKCCAGYMDFLFLFFCVLYDSCVVVSDFCVIFVEIVCVCRVVVFSCQIFVFLSGASLVI